MRDFLCYYANALWEAVRHSLDAAQSIIFLLLLAAGAVVYFDPKAKAAVDAANVSGWEVAFWILAAVVGARILLAPYWIYADQRAKLVTAQEALTRISEDRPFTYTSTDFDLRSDRRQQNEITRLNFLFENLGDRMLRWNIRELFFTINGHRMDVYVPENPPLYIHARQEMGYGFDVQGASLGPLPTEIIVGFDIHYDNDPPIRSRGTRRVIRHSFSSFAPMNWSNLILEADEYWPGANS